LPLLDYLTPTLYALAVVVGEKRYSRLMIVAVVCYTFCGLLFGRRMESGTWLLVLLWHFTTIRGKPIRLSRLLVGFTLVGCAFQLVEILWTGTDNVDFILMEFFTGQGVIFMIPALSWLLPGHFLHLRTGHVLVRGPLWAIGMVVVQMGTRVFAKPRCPFLSLCMFTFAFLCSTLLVVHCHFVDCLHLIFHGCKLHSEPVLLPDPSQ